MFIELTVDLIGIFLNAFIIKYAKVKLALMVDPSINKTKNLICYWLYKIMIVQAYIQIFFWFLGILPHLWNYFQFKDVEEITKDNSSLYLTLFLMIYT